MASKVMLGGERLRTALEIVFETIENLLATSAHQGGFGEEGHANIGSKLGP